jgi:hypothetical protein
MKQVIADNKHDRLVSNLSRMWIDPQDRLLIPGTIQVLDGRYALNVKMDREPEVEEIIMQMFGRLAKAFGRVSNIQNKSILDIACGSNTSKLPALLHIHTSQGEKLFGRTHRGYTALFEPWFCRILFELGARPVGVDFGDLEHEAYIHYRLDLGKRGALDFLPDHSFDAIQDSRLFGSPEFTAEFPDQADRLKVAQEIYQQEKRLLKTDGVMIHSDATALLR